MWYRALIPGARWRIPAREGKSIYLTFDDGPIPEVTPWVLDELDRLGVKATFFCVGDNVRKYPDLLVEILRRGHGIGNHTYHHIQGLKTSANRYLEDVEKADALIGSRYFRPPHGHLRLSQIKKLSNRFDLIMWDVVTRDYNASLSPETIMGYVRRYARNGSIIVFHDSLKAQKNMRIVMPQAVEWLLEQGYRFMRIGDDLDPIDTSLPSRIREIISMGQDEEQSSSSLLL
ncbi:polysaccharide deacetylase family protein [Porphyromonas crevioricanis]|uniref:Bifunctional xylanase/deacetylase n=2 Tax=Porphyromonas crevioricanis TaxID=393921 RepID=A0A2X4Q010_9PORP|nr:polysaccharide deacetylase family protein [Porphyromonas crevioricanis]SJZ57691.1 Peptidoglycan/xylan/chitin deacetylase, PgdA/CDA1 family [Porphyromonas crevioricanis]SQH73427.1 Bifunctional xylanase/deacetylase precursor [Porphyromonas crevioricanis]